MKICRWLFCLLVLCAGPLPAQVPITQPPLTPDAAAAITTFYNGANTTRLTGDSHIAAGNDVSGNVAVLEGNLTLGGHIAGDLLVINGDALFEEGARVDGTVLLVGGSIHNVQNLAAAGVTWYRERLKYELRDGAIVLTHEAIAPGELSAGKQFGFGRTDLVVAARGGYNRSEGLPIYIGPRLTFSSKRPALLEGLFIFRTAAAFSMDEEDFGYALRAEQNLAGERAPRIGLRYARELLPMETWGLSDRENSLAAFVLHRDYRDYYTREGWSAYVTGRNAIDWRVEFSNAAFGTAPARDPYSLRDNPNPWRPHVAIAPVRLALLRAQARYDTRNENRDPSTGWLARGEVEGAVSLRSGSAAGFDEHYRYGLLDVRRYARLSPLARIGLRAVAAGSLAGTALPAFRQQTLGGAGSLPGYELYAFDCGAHHAPAELAPQPEYYGCDRLALVQLEYQARFRWLSRIGSSIGSDFGLLENIRGVLFFDAGRAWTEAPAVGARSAGTSDFLADVGFGLRFGTLGAYWALPLSARRQGLHFILRLEPRI